jgi:hypothetical protein
VGRCPGYAANWALPLYNRRIMGGAVSTAASSCIAAGLTETTVATALPYLSYTIDILVIQKNSKLRLLGKKFFSFLGC